MFKNSGEVKLFGKEYKDTLKEDIGCVFDNSYMIETYNIKDINRIMKNVYKRWDSKCIYKSRD